VSRGGAKQDLHDQRVELRGERIDHHDVPHDDTVLHSPALVMVPNSRARIARID
jgi:hypothetical protein